MLQGTEAEVRLVLVEQDIVTEIPTILQCTILQTFYKTLL